MGLKTYDQDQTEDTQGSKESTGIASCHVNYRPWGTALQMTGECRQGFRDEDWSKWGLIDGDPAMIENMLKNFINNTGFIGKTLNNQLTGAEGAKLSLKLKNLTENAIARMHGGSNDPIISTSRNPGKRKKAFVFSGAFTSGGTTSWTFTITPIATNTAGTGNAISVAWNTSDAQTKADLLAAVKAVTGIDQTLTAWSSHTLNVYAATGYFFTTTVAAAITGGSTTLTSATETDTAILTTAVDTSTGTLSKTQIPLTATTGAAAIATAITNGTRQGVPGTPQIRLLTGTTVTAYETPRVAYMSGNVAILAEPLQNLPSNAAVIDVVADVEYNPVGQNLPADVEVQLNFKNHSDASVYIVAIPRASHDVSTKPPNFTPEGFKGNIDLLLIDTLITVNSVPSLRPYKAKKINNSVGNE